jgi:hypothetical protein
MWISKGLVLRDPNTGDYIKDPDWDEYILDITSEAKRLKIAVVVSDWIAGCATSGFKAVEIDNLDTYSRVKGGLIKKSDAIAMMAKFSAIAHSNNLAIGQKNAPELAQDKG